MDSNKLREAALARLSMTALAIDALIVLVIFILLAGLFDTVEFKTLFGLFPHGFGFMPYLFAFVVIISVYLFVVEVLLAGLSIGRLCLGLQIRDEETGHAPVISHRLVRVAQIILKLGISSLHPQKVPAHNKRANGALRSDWVEIDLHTQTRRTNSKSMSAAKKTGGVFLKKLSDPSSARMVNLQSGRHFSSKGTYYLGREPKTCDMVLPHDKSVSRTHCRIVKKGDQFLLADGENVSKVSTGGTYLNGKKLATVNGYPLKNGDNIKIGNSEIQFVMR